MAVRGCGGAMTSVSRCRTACTFNSLRIARQQAQARPGARTSAAAPGPGRQQWRERRAFARRPRRTRMDPADRTSAILERGLQTITALRSSRHAGGTVQTIVTRSITTRPSAHAVPDPEGRQLSLGTTPPGRRRVAAPDDRRSAGFALTTTYEYDALGARADHGSARASDPCAHALDQWCESPTARASPRERLSLLLRLCRSLVRTDVRNADRAASAPESHLSRSRSTTPRQLVRRRARSPRANA